MRARRDAAARWSAPAIAVNVMLAAMPWPRVAPLVAGALPRLARYWPISCDGGWQPPPAFPVWPLWYARVGLTRASSRCAAVVGRGDPVPGGAPGVSRRLRQRSWRRCDWAAFQQLACKIASRVRSGELRRGKRIAGTRNLKSGMSVQLTPHLETCKLVRPLRRFRLFLDPHPDLAVRLLRTRRHMTRAGGPVAKIDLALGKLNLEPGMTLLASAAAGGATITARHREIRRQCRGPDVVGEPGRSCPENVRQMDTPLRQYCWRDGADGEPVDRIVSIGAFEHFGRQRYHHFFEVTHRTLPTDGKVFATPSAPTFKKAGEKG